MTEMLWVCYFLLYTWSRALMHYNWNYSLENVNEPEQIRKTSFSSLLPIRLITFDLV